MKRIPRTRIMPVLEAMGIMATMARSDARRDALQSWLLSSDESSEASSSSASSSFLVVPHLHPPPRAALMARTRRKMRLTTKARTTMKIASPPTDWTKSWLSARRLMMSSIASSAKMMAELGSSSSAPAQSNGAAHSSQRPSSSPETALPSANVGNHSHSHTATATTTAATSPAFQHGLPVKRKPSEQGQDDSAHMKFSLLSKKGSKQVTHEVNVPSTASIAVNTRTKQLKEEAERKQRKELVLAYERNADSQQSQAGAFAQNAFLRRPQQQTTAATAEGTGSANRTKNAASGRLQDLDQSRVLIRNGDALFVIACL